MKITGADLPRLQLGLLAALLMIAGGAGSVHLALKSIRDAQVAQASAQKQSNDVDAKLRQVRSEEAEIKQKSAVFNALEARGVIGEEQRLEWVELLKTIRERRRLLDLQYEIAPQRVLDPAPGSSLAFYASTMKLELKLLHEEDLTRLLDDLRQQARALIQIRSCKVWRLPRAAGESATNAQLQAACQIDWITLHQTPAAGSTR